MQNVCDITFEFDNRNRIFEIGESVSGTLQLTPQRSVQCKDIKLELFWRTHGRGNRAQGKATTLDVDFNELSLELGQTYSFPFRFNAPPGPLTYRGHYLNVDWYLRAVLDLPLRPGFLDPKDETEILLLPKEGVYVDLGPKYEMPTAEVQRANKVQRPAVLIGAFFSAFSLLFVLPALQSGGFVSLFFLLIPGIFFLVGLALIFGGLRNRLATQRLGEVDLEFNERELVPGETLTCQLSFTPKSAVDLTRLRFKLEAKEKVVSGSGTNKTTHTHTLFEEERTPLESQTLNAGELTEITESFTLPLDAPYTFAAEDNQLLWELNVLIDTKGILDWSHDYPLAVMPWREEAIL